MSKYDNAKAPGVSKKWRVNRSAFEAGLGALETLPPGSIVTATCAKDDGHDICFDSQINRPLSMRKNMTKNRAV